MDTSGLKNLTLEGQTIVWQKSYSPLAVTADRIRAVLDKIIIGLLIVFCVAGVVVLIWHIYQIAVVRLDIFQSSVWQESYLQWVWWASLAALFLFYWRQHRQHGLQRVLAQGSGENAKKNRTIDISPAFSRHSRRVMEDAFSIAMHDQDSAIQPIHIFAGLLHSQDVMVIISRLGISNKQLRQTIARIIRDDGVVTRGGELNLDEAAQDIMLQSYLLAYERRQADVDVAEILEATVKMTPTVKDILFDFKITEDKLSNVIAWIRIQQTLRDRYEKFRYKAGFKPKGTMDRAMTAVATPTLDIFSEDLTALARSGYFGLCVARDKEFADIYRALESGSAPLLVGYSGVGIDTIVEGLASQMVAEEVPAVLQDKRLVSLQISRLVAGATHEGELEQRVMQIVNELIRAGNIMIYINNIHNLVGVSSVGRSNVDLADVLTESLLKRGLLVLASSTPTDYTKFIENSSLHTVLSKIEINEPAENEAIQMLAANVGRIEHKNEVFFSYDALEQAVKLSGRYLHDRYLPRKAIDVIEETATRVRSKRGARQIVTGQDVGELVSEKAEVPVSQVTQDESNKLMNLEQLIHERIINQVEAVSAVSSALRRARAELRDMKRPIASFLFLGPTGVGKTELAKTVAGVYFGNDEKMIRLDMSEYQEKNSLQRLLGNPGGDIGGILTNAVRQDPYSILLLDEIEKAHPDILNVFLQVMEDGRLTDVTGRTIDFTNIVFIATSNAGTTYIQDRTKAGATAEQIKVELMEKELRPYFRPEFLNRFDNIVVFKPLTQDHIEQIAVLLIKKEQQRMKEKGIYFEATPAAIKQLAQDGYDPNYGARPLRRVIQEQVQNSLANFLLTGSIDRRDKVVLEADGRITIEKATRL
ncbi:MAG: ATP-dependent Clp protease ATP-binding subunit [Candidatus Komeilibacteria bacterium]|nr:ATP-dependent Clp protease ATP-binding subunit [Candidatus Komeilibacteria bacterium]